MNKAAKAKRAELDRRAKYYPPADVKPNKQDRKAKAKRITKQIDFTGKVGLARSQINYAAKTAFPGKPKQGTAAKRRAAPLRNELTAQREADAAAYHIHPRHKRTVKPRLKANMRKLNAIAREKRVKAEKAKLVEA